MQQGFVVAPVFIHFYAEVQKNMFPYKLFNIFTGLCSKPFNPGAFMAKNYCFLCFTGNVQGRLYTNNVFFLFVCFNKYLYRVRNFFWIKKQDLFAYYFRNKKTYLIKKWVIKTLKIFWVNHSIYQRLNPNFANPLNVMHNATTTTLSDNILFDDNNQLKHYVPFL